MKKKFTTLLLFVLVFAFAVVASGDTVFAKKDKDKAKKDEGYTVSGTKIKVKAKNGADITKNLDKAFEYARDKATDKKQYTVVIPKGDYKLSGVTHIWSNTTLDLTAGVTITSTNGAHSLIISGTNGKYKGKKDFNASPACKGYNGFKNITIKGGTFKSTTNNSSTIIRIAHAKNVTLEDVVVTGGGCAHQIEVAAIDGFKVTGCTFKNLKELAKYKNDKQEALQLDIACATGVFRGVYLDGTPIKNVEVTGCTFADVPRGVGSHTLLNGAYFTNVKINNNTFKNISEEAIVCVNYKDCEIKDNTITNCGGGVLFDYFKATYNSSVYTTIFDGKKAYNGTIEHAANTEISGNKITTKYGKTCDEVCGIKVYGFNLEQSAKGADKKKIPAKNYYVSGVNILNNTITTAGYGIHVMDLTDSTISGNTVSQAGVSGSDKHKSEYDGIFVEKESKNITVNTNSVSGSKSSGIVVGYSSQVNDITSNVVSGAAGEGINIFESSSVNVITANTIDKSGKYGIIVSTKSSTGDISGNSISGDGVAAINVFSNSSAGNISNNTIAATGSGYSSAVIKLTENATVASVDTNTISGATVAPSAIMLETSTISGSINANDIGKTSATSIKITNKSTIGGNISGNTVNGAAGEGILFDASSVISGAITGNTITGVSNNGIKVTDKSQVGAITSNKITASTGILMDSSNVSGNISENTITASSDNGIKISGKSVIGGEISGNVVENKVILISDSTVKGTITKNKAGRIKITGSTTGGCTLEGNPDTPDIYIG